MAKNLYHTIQRAVILGGLIFFFQSNFAQFPNKEIPKGLVKSIYVSGEDKIFFSQGTFIIRSTKDYRYLTIKDITPVQRSMVYLWGYTENQVQQSWKFISQPGGYYKIQSVSGYFLTQRTLLAPTIELATNDNNQLWLVKETGDGYFSLKSKTNQYLKLNDRRYRNGAIIGFSKTFQNSVEYKWHLIKMTSDGRKTTDFNPGTMGFKFYNTFRGVDGSYRYGGLCGGMVYSSLDYYHAKKAIPNQTYKPANRTPLQSYIFGRQNNSSIESNLDRWIELRADALGTRNSEFFEWGLRGYNGGRLEELRKKIDAGVSVPLGLYSGMAKGIDGYKSGDHQVLAIGYALGRYTGDLKGHPEDLKIFIYNPNNPTKTMTLIPDMANKCYLEVESGICWRTYFVDSKYSPKIPLDINNLDANEPDGSIRHIYATFLTGGDDLRGGNDNVNLTVNYKDGSNQTFNNINRGARWVDNNDETVPLVLNRAISKSDISSFTIATTFGGGFDGDNWNLDKFEVTNGGNFSIVCANCEKNDRMPMVRFTGDKKTHTVIVQ